MDRGAFEKAMELAEDEVMPCVSPLGYPAKKMSLRESMMRKGVRADERLRFEDVVYRNDFEQPMMSAAAGKLDMQKIDMGIALCHFELMAKELGICPEFVIADPNIPCKTEVEYIASYKFKI